MSGAWQTMSRQDWQRVQRQWLGTGHGMSTWAIVAIALAGVLLAALALLAITRRSSRRPASPA